MLIKRGEMKKKLYFDRTEALEAMYALKANPRLYCITLDFIGNELRLSCYSKDEFVPSIDGDFIESWYTNERHPEWKQDNFFWWIFD